MADLKTRLIQLLDLSRSFQQQLIADLTPAERNATGTWEEWSIKDELAHVVAWQFNSLARMSALLQAEPVPDFGDFEAINQAVYRTNHERPLAEIVAEADRAHVDLVNLIDASSEADLSEPARFSDQAPRSLAAQIMSMASSIPTRITRTIISGAASWGRPRSWSKRAQPLWRICPSGTAQRAII